MCGIIGYIGNDNAADVLLNGLKRLEYRGYDSAGIAGVSPEGCLEVRRAVGKLENLEKMLQAQPLAGTVGIGHTRWATHGRPSVENAHPHCAGPVAVIHNGIIENYVALREKLLSRGHRFTSQTDTEVISHLIEERIKRGMRLAEAVRDAVRELRGSFAIVVISETEPRRLVAAKTATPLVIGLGTGEALVASDIPALLDRTREAIVMGDGELAEITAEGVEIRDFNGGRVTRAARRITSNVSDVGKGHFRHYLRKEIAEQPRAWADTLAGRAVLGEPTVRFEEDLLGPIAPSELRRIVLVSAGASYISSLIGKFIIEEMAQIPVEVDYSAEFRYRNPCVDARTIVIGVSQSGETADTLAAMEEAARRGARVLAITNTVDSSIAQHAAARIYTRCGPEISVTTTKCFLTQIEIFSLLGVHLASLRQVISPETATDLLASLFAAPPLIEAAIGLEPEIERIAKRFANARDFLYLGRGLSFPVALEGALKLKEISYIHAEGYSAGEMKHGPIALIDENMPVVVLIPRDHTFEKTLSNLKEVESRNGRIIAVTNEPSPELAAVIEEVIQVPRSHQLLVPVLMTVPLQLLAYHIAVFRGTDVDQPRNLAKSVTVE